MQIVVYQLHIFSGERAHTGQQPASTDGSENIAASTESPRGPQLQISSGSGLTLLNEAQSREHLVHQRLDENQGFLVLSDLVDQSNNR